MDFRGMLAGGKTIYFDGGMGTLLQSKLAAQTELPANVLPEALNILRPQWIQDIHRGYIEAGADVVYTNTFGANCYKLAGSGYTVEDVTRAAVANARAAAGQDALVALDIGPIGQLLAPAGTLSFQEAWQAFAQLVRAGAPGADLVCIETIADLGEARAALLAVKECCDLPVVCTMTFEENGRTFTGCSAASAAIALSALGADAVGLNCSLGPKEMLPVAREFMAWTDKPVVIKPNAGLPDPATGQYTITPVEFAGYMAEMKAMGAAVLGGCCGTNPAFITTLRAQTEALPTGRRPVRQGPALCSAGKVSTGGRMRLIGERINPTGKKRFQQALLAGDMDYILRLGLEQAAAGADILDINLGFPGVDEAALMPRVVTELSGVADLPLQLDSADPAALEAGLRVYAGKALVNSVNGTEKSLSTVLPLVKKYGAAVVGLTLDEGGIPDTAQGRLAIAARILDRAVALGIPKEDVIIDCLTMAVSAQPDAAQVTLQALALVKERLGLATLLGVSNISFGLPSRGLVNRAFLAMAMDAGLDFAIMNPAGTGVGETACAMELLLGRDEGAQRYIAAYSAAVPAVSDKPVAAGTDLAYAVSGGLRAEAAAGARALLSAQEPMDIVNNILVPALDAVGKGYEAGTLFLPQLMRSAAAAQAAFEEIRLYLAAHGGPSAARGHIVLATVQGDIHDIGKNIVKVLLENYGFGVVDLGRNVPPEDVVKAALANKAELIGLSALMTTTLPGMEATIRALREAGATGKIVVGGAVLTASYAKSIGADYYAKDAGETVEIARKIIG